MYSIAQSQANTQSGSTTRASQTHRPTNKYIGQSFALLAGNAARKAPRYFHGQVVGGAHDGAAVLLRAKDSGIPGAGLPLPSIKL